MKSNRAGSIAGIFVFVSLALCAAQTSIAGFGVGGTTLSWDAQPRLGIIKGDYYRIEERFRQGHLGVLEVVKQGDRLVHVEFNELTRPNYYNRFFQAVPKRLSEYNFSMGATKGAAWIQSVVLVERAMVEQQRITGKFDVVSGASNSINQSMLPLAAKLNPGLSRPTSQAYYAIAEKLGGGLTGHLKIILGDGRITECRYDEIFANDPSEIANPALKQFYRQSKYQSVLYDEPSRIGFNIQMDALNDAVVKNQNLFDISGLPAIASTGNYGTSGYTERNSAWDNYLRLAAKLKEEMDKDKALR